MGITENEFWSMNPRLLKPYFLAEKLKLEQANLIAWLQGLYVHHAVGSVLANMFGKNSKKVSYLKEPIELEKKQLSVEDEEQRVIRFLDQLKNNFDRSHKSVMLPEAQRGD